MMTQNSQQDRQYGELRAHRIREREIKGETKARVGWSSFFLAISTPTPHLQAPRDLVQPQL